MTKLSVNINKVALLRNSRESNIPDLLQFAKDCEEFGADGITIHPRPDQRHIRYSDVLPLRKANTTEFNMEGYPSEEFLRLVEKAVPDQCTLVPDAPGILTSSEGWNTVKNIFFLQDVISRIQAKSIRVSLFLDPAERFIEGAREAGADRIELYTGQFASEFNTDPAKAVEPHVRASQLAKDIGLGLNAGHDLNLVNLRHYQSSVLALKEVSIGHALISDALYYGIQNVIQMYKRCLE